MILSAVEILKAMKNLKGVAYYTPLTYSEKKIFRALRKLFKKGIVDSENRRYKLLNH